MALKRVRLPKDAMLSNTFTLMDTSEDQVFLFIENHGKETPFGNLYISDEKGRIFTLSIEKVIKGSMVDFEKVSSLDGTFIVNKYNSDYEASFKHSTVFDANEINESDLVAEESRKSRLGRGGRDNAKHEQTSSEVTREHPSVPAEIVQQDVRTYITHNKGGKWELLKAPTVTSQGKPIQCSVEDDCSLHLEIYSHQGELAPVYSTETAVGIVVATGNLGKRLTPNDQAKNLYISRDGGLNWKSVRPGSYIYEIGDHGAIIVIAKKNEPIDSIEFTWDEGLTWETLKITDKKIRVQNIIIEPNSISQ